jgi:hypothetical protein
LGELDDHIDFLNDHVDDVGALEVTVIATQNYIPAIPKDFNKFTSFYNSSFSNNSLLNYFRGDNPTNIRLGVLVTTNNNEYNQPLFQINKSYNEIRIGSNFYEY